MRPEIVIPLFNEEDNVPALAEALCVKEIADVADFVIVNNGSSDRTQEKLEECVPGSAAHIQIVNSAENLNYGGGILLGLAHTRSEYIGWTHGDMQTPVSDIRLAISYLRNGKRVLVKGRRVGRPAVDELTSKLMSSLLHLILHVRFVDINAQPTIIHRSLLDSSLTKFKGFDFDLATVFFANLYGHSQQRFFVSFPKRLAGQSAWKVGPLARLRMGIKMFESMLRLRRFTGSTQ